jgi:hypothetical protein
MGHRVGAGYPADPESLEETRERTGRKAEVVME